MKDKVKKIQDYLKIKSDGDFGPLTILAVAKELKCDPIVKSIQTLLSIKADGVIGPVTINTLLKKFNLITIVDGIPQSAIDLILESEGIDQPWHWPGGGSGITLGYGADIGADPDSLIYWVGVLKDSEIEILKQAKGKTGRSAAEIKTRFKGINITKSQALEVFYKRTLPIEINRTIDAFPGIELMPREVLGALVSLVYNRGTDLDGSRRVEMKNIHDRLVEYSKISPDNIRSASTNDCIKYISLQFRKMKRLWIGQGLDGLLTRRDAEADLCLEALN